VPKVSCALKPDPKDPSVSYTIPDQFLCPNRDTGIEEDQRS